MPSKRATGGAARPTGETAVRRYTAAEWAERERQLQASLIGRGPGDPRTHLRVVHDADGTRVSIGAHLPHPAGDGLAGQTVDLEPDAEHVRALVATCEQVLAAHRGRAEGAATIAWAQTLLAHVAAGGVGE
jgi:hypothetical protein